MAVKQLPEAERTAIDGTHVLHLPVERDERGSLAELIRNEWFEPVAIVQWNVVTSAAGALRGVHWHNLHHDVISPVHGRLLVGLADLRRDSPTERATTVLELDATDASAIVVPPGVAHGLMSAESTVTMYGVSRYWDGEDELEVRWDDPELGIAWPAFARPPRLSARDAAAPQLADAGPLPPWRGD